MRQRLITKPAIATVAALALSAGERFGEQLAARHKVDGEWRELTYAEVTAAIDEIALGLVELGIEAGRPGRLLANTRPEWTLASFAISAAGAVVVPIYPTNSPEECAVGARQLRRAGRDLRGRGPAGEDRAGPGELPRARARRS